MTIWHGGHAPTLESVQAILADTIAAHLGIAITDIGSDYLRGSMPVDSRTRQPYGILHGGASVVLAETLGSTAAGLSCDPATNRVVGLDVNANHVRSIADGVVTGTARPFHIGRSTQVWSIEIVNGNGELICVCRLTMAVLGRRQDAE